MISRSSGQSRSPRSVRSKPACGPYRDAPEPPCNSNPSWGRPHASRSQGRAPPDTSRALPRCWHSRPAPDAIPIPQAISASLAIDDAARMMCSSCKRVIDIPPLPRRKRARERRALPQGGHSFTVFDNERQHLFEWHRKDPPPLFKVRLRSSRVRRPSGQVVVRHSQQFRTTPQFRRDRPVHCETAGVYSSVSGQRHAASKHPTGHRGIVYDLK